ncbi:MAG: hypothetical protein KF830_18095 [Planctomycetes bacterium]|nr:hypothetical protein [Planctomycetota bacterium]
MTRRPSPASRSSSTARAARGARPRADGRVDASCPQCGTVYRLAPEALDDKMECVECHRVFFPKTTVGKRAKAPDHTKTYVLMGAGALAVIVLFAVMANVGGGTEPDATPRAEAPRREVHTRGSHPRTAQIVQWAQAMGSDNRLVIKTHNDLRAVATKLGAPAGDELALFTAIQSAEATRYLREMVADSAALDSDEAMTAGSGKAIVYVTPKPGTDDYKRNTRGELLVSFTMAGDQVKVTDWEVKLAPVRNPAKPDPSKTSFTPNKDIAKPEFVEITDSGGTRKVQESKPAPVPHWERATPAQQAMADKIVADILASAAPEAPGGLFNRATLQVRTDDDRKAVVPRVLNAMHDCYADVTANNMKLNLLNRAMVGFTGFAVNYQVEDSGNPTKDKAERESCVRQWFAFWWRYSGDLGKWFDTRENLEEPLEENPPKRAM